MTLVPFISISPAVGVDFGGGSAPFEGGDLEDLLDGRRDEEFFDEVFDEFFDLSGLEGFFRTFSPFCPTRFFNWSKILQNLGFHEEEFRG